MVSVPLNTCLLWSPDSHNAVILMLLCFAVTGHIRPTWPPSWEPGRSRRSYRNLSLTWWCEDAGSPGGKRQVTDALTNHSLTSGYQWWSNRSLATIKLSATGFLLIDQSIAEVTNGATAASQLEPPSSNHVTPLLAMLGQYCYQFLQPLHPPQHPPVGSDGGLQVFAHHSHHSCVIVRASDQVGD